MTEAQIRWYAAHKEEKKAYDAKYREENAEKKKAQRQAYYLANKAKVMAKNADWVRRNPEKKKAMTRRYTVKYADRCAAATRAWYQKNRDHALKTARIRQLKNLYGMTIQEFQAMLKKQKGMCPICQTKITLKNPPVDHCHKTGKARGILCNSCNWGLGHFKDDLTVMASAIKYLRKHGQTTVLT